MLKRLLDSPWFYFAGAGILLIAAVASQLEVRLPSRPVEPPQAILELRDRKDLNIVFILVDTLRADRLGIYGHNRRTSPTMDDLARHGVLFRNTLSQSSWTKTSMASMWTGTHPIRNGILRYMHVVPEEAVMPAEILKEAGYRTAGIWRNGWVEPYFGFGQGFDSYVRPRPGHERAQIQRRSPSPKQLPGTDEDVTQSAGEFLDNFGDDRFFLYLHFMDIHQYVYDDKAPQFGTSYSDAYDQSVNWTDRLVGEVVEQLDERDLLDRTLVVISSDHGEAFLEHGFEGHARNLYSEVTEVPLIFVFPFILEPGIEVDTRVSNVDIWPTILDLAGVPPLPNADGRSLVPLMLEAAGVEQAGDTGFPRPAFGQLDRWWGNPRLESDPMVAVTHGDQRLVVWTNSPERTELYDLSADPGEQENLYHDDPEAAAPLEAFVDAYRKASDNAWGVTPEEVELNEMRLQQLRALGYVIPQ